MIKFTSGNLLEADAEALVNTVNAVGVMGKGIALMFKERFADNFERYAAACKAKEVRVGKMFVTEPGELGGPQWIVNFPTKQHWKAPSQMPWIVEGLQDLRRFLVENRVKSVALPPLGAGNGGLEWEAVRGQIERELADLAGVEVLVFEPISKYQNVAKRKGAEKLTPARALIAELVRRYWVLGMECSLLEVQKLAWFLERAIERLAPSNPLDLRFIANKYGPYADRLRHLLDGLDGSYLHCDKRIGDADRLEPIWFDNERTDVVQSYLKSADAKPFAAALEHTVRLIDGFESPFGMELLATVDWLLEREKCAPTVSGIREGLRKWPVGAAAAERKCRLFDDRAIGIALNRLNTQYDLAFAA
ncbi:MAG: macro domain-containing protein [Betaproteobacteria bacterium]|nr:macro domain-containing protein [Betaproteobacteria bacterium]